MTLKKLLLTAMISITAAYAEGAPSRMRPIEVIAPDGKPVTVVAMGDEHDHWYEAATGGATVGWLPRCTRAKATPAMKVRGQSTGRVTTFPTQGDLHFLVVLVEFADKVFSFTDPVEEFNAMLNAPGYDRYKGNGSVADYYRDCSAGQFRPVFDVVGPVRMSHGYGYYGSGSDDSAAGLMVIEACRALEGKVDFSRYDIDRDGRVDNIYFYYAGLGEADGGDPSTIWPHSWNLSDQQRYLELNGVSIDAYACSPELDGSSKPNGIGTFCHEFGHVLGLPDLYASAYSDALHPATWSLMASGNYNDDGRTPPGLSSYERLELGWITPRELSYPLTVTLEPLCDSNRACRISTERTNEYFLLENRQQYGWDKSLPGHGMLVWHIDYNPNIWERNVVNHTASHQYVDIVEANNATSHNRDSGFTFPGADHKTSFTSSTTPALRSWSGQPIDCPITGITETSSGLITFNACGGKTPVGRVDGLKVIETTQEECKLAWHSVDGAKDYIVRISDEDTGSDVCTMKVEVPETTASGLWPEHRYIASVAAEDEYETGEPATIAFAMPEADFAHTRVVITSAYAVTESSLRAEWNSVAAADSYEVALYMMHTADTDERLFGFDNRELPAGWSSEGTTWSSVAGYYGQSAPALRMSADASWLNTGLFESDIRNISLLMRGSTLTDGTRLQITGIMEDGSAIELATLTPDASEAKTYNVPVEERGVRALRFTMLRTGKSVLSIDDITITLVGEEWELKGRYPSESNTLTVGNLNQGGAYAVEITALSGDDRSLPSERAFVKLSGSGYVDKVTAPVDLNHIIEIYTTTGVKLPAGKFVPPGIYIVRTPEGYATVRL